MIPPRILDSLAATPVSLQIRDTATELAVRIEGGEFDDLDDLQRMDLQWLTVIMQAWARRVQALETGLPIGASLSEHGGEHPAP